MIFIHFKRNHAIAMYQLIFFLLLNVACSDNIEYIEYDISGVYDGTNAKKVTVIDQAPGLNSYSWNFWFKTDARPHRQVLVTNGHSSVGDNSSGWTIYKQNNSIYFRLVSENDSSITARAITKDRMWHMITGIIDRDVEAFSMYVDGDLVSTELLNSLDVIRPSDTLSAGQFLNGSTRFQGSIAAFVSIPKALNKESIDELYKKLPKISDMPIDILSIDELENDMEIKLIDLSEDINRQYIVDREDGIYFGHPTTLKIEEDGNEAILAVYPKGAHAKGITTLRKSRDGGKTWDEPNPSASALERIFEVPTIHKLTDRRGIERLIIFTGLYPVRISFSEDNGETWSAYSPVGDWGGIVTMGDLIPIKNSPEDPEFAAGKYMAFFHDDGRFFAENGQRRSNPRSVRLFKTLTEDGGLTWSYPELIWENTEKFICEPGLVRSPDGKQLAMLLRENFRNHNAQIIFSNDEGKSWSEPKDLPRSLTGDRHVLRYSNDGRIVCVFRDRQKNTTPSSTEGDYIAWVGTYEDILNGSPGQYRVRLLNNYNGWDCGYSGLELLEDGTFLATTYLMYRPEDSPNNSVVSVRFTVEELDNLH